MNRPFRSPAASSTAPELAATSRFTPCDPIEGYGTRGRCIVCGHGFYGCICDVPDIDVPHVSDMKRIMPWLFDDDDDGFVFVERISPTRVAL
jgi:hypothetical protein